MLRNKGCETECEREEEERARGRTLSIWSCSLFLWVANEVGGKVRKKKGTWLANTLQEAT